MIIHTASVADVPEGIDLTVNVPNEIGRKTLREHNTPGGLRALAQFLLDASEAVS